MRIPMHSSHLVFFRISFRPNSVKRFYSKWLSSLILPSDPPATFFRVLFNKTLSAPRPTCTGIFQGSISLSLLFPDFPDCLWSHKLCFARLFDTWKNWVEAGFPTVSLDYFLTALSVMADNNYLLPFNSHQPSKMQLATGTWQFRPNPFNPV